ncbi:MAG: hypothetical protein WC405_04815 [Syntrophales bacterium]
MNMSIIVFLAIAISGATYIAIAWRIHNHSTKLDDHLPITSHDSQAIVKNTKEFSSATVATTISLATVILAYAELAGYMGTWLFWTVITTAIGIFAMRMASPFIWRKLTEKGTWRPTLHEFLGTSYDSLVLKKGAALCTSFGFISALAVELTVGSRFLNSLVPVVPVWLALLVVAGIGVGYTTIGGFRVVVVTDRIQMFAIWMSLAALGLLEIIGISLAGGVSFIIEKVPATMYNFSWREGLYAFLIGIAVINIPTFIADMSIWQRIAASNDEETVKRGLNRSVISALFSWGALATIACLLVVLVSPKNGENQLITFILQMGTSHSVLVGLLLLVVIIGLYAASLSTASTQLIAAGHTLHTDILRSSYDKEELAHSRKELNVSKLILTICAIVAIFIVEGLRALGFSIADLVFAVYGAQLGMVPVVISALIFRKDILKKIGSFATFGVLVGFAAGWGAAGYGKLSANGDLVFLSPVISLIISTVTLLIGLLFNLFSCRKSAIG